MISTHEMTIPQDVQQKYLALGDTRLAHFSVASLHEPEQPCGTAYRIGATVGVGKTVKLYRIRIRSPFSSRQMMLPEMFALNTGILHQYHS